jgi:hypothetical protein
MEGLERLVSESFARHGVETAFDHRRLQWSQWFRCGDSFRLVQLSSKPGLFALADEVIPPGEVPAGGKRMLALFRISEADDLGMALGRLFLPGSPERLAVGCCFARYALIEDATQRHAAYSALQSWVASSGSGIPEDRRNLGPETGLQHRLGPEGKQPPSGIHWGCLDVREGK